MAMLKPALKSTKNSKVCRGSFNELYDFYVRGELTDAIVDVRGCQIKVHKIVLALKSPVFRAMLQSGMREGSTNFIKIDDTSPEVFRQVVHYMYCGFCPDLRKHHLGIFECADKYELTELVDICEGMFETCMDESRAVEYLNAADMHSRKHLKDKILDFMKTKLRDVMRTDDWPYMDFRLRTELALRFSNNNGNMIPRPDESCIEIESEKTVIWWASEGSFLSGEPITSPRFQIIVRSEVISFCFIFCRYNHSCSPVQMVILSHFVDPVTLHGQFVLQGTNMQVSREKILTWTLADINVPYYAVPRRKNTLSVKMINPHRNQDFHASNKIKLSFTIVSHSASCLKKHEPKLLLDITPYFNSGQFSDVKFEVEGQIFLGHRLVLAALCTHFETMFQHQGNSYYSLTGVTARDFGAVLRYLYTNELPGSGRDIIDEKTLDIARICGLVVLFNHCEQVLVARVKPQTAVQALINGHQVCAYRLKERAKWFITHDIKAATAQPSWKLLSEHPDLINELLFDLAGVCPLLQDDLSEDSPLPLPQDLW